MLFVIPVAFDDGLSLKWCNELIHGQKELSSKQFESPLRRQPGRKKVKLAAKAQAFGMGTDLLDHWGRSSGC